MVTKILPIDTSHSFGFESAGLYRAVSSFGAEEIHFPTISHKLMVDLAYLTEHKTGSRHIIKAIELVGEHGLIGHDNESFLSLHEKK